MKHEGDSNGGTGAILLIFWIGLIFTSFPQNWKDEFFVGIFLAVLFGPPLLLLLFHLLSAASGTSGVKESRPTGSEPANGIYAIHSFDQMGMLFVGLLVGGVIGWLAPMWLGQPHHPEWMREPYVGWGVGVLAFLLISGIDYQDVLNVKGCSRAKRFRYYGITLFASSKYLDVPYHLNWEWTCHREKVSEHSSRTVYELQLRAHAMGSVPVKSYREENLPESAKLDEIGQRFASWNNGRIFTYTPLLDGIPNKPW